MSKLLPKDQLAAHVDQFPGVPPERKRQIADHLSALPDHLHDPVHDVLVDDAPEEAEGKFIVGCFVAPPAPSVVRSLEHGDLPPAA